MESLDRGAVDPRKGHNVRCVRSAYKLVLRNGTTRGGSDAYSSWWRVAAPDVTLSIAVFSALAVAGATSARVDDASSGSSTAAALDKPEFVTFCHIAGRADDPANMVTLTLPYDAVFGQAGHFNEDGTPNAGHENDYLGPCNEILLRRPLLRRPS